MNSKPKRIYLDHAATTPPCDAALHAMRDVAERAAYNPSSLHAEGRRARSALDDSRQRIAALLNAAPSEIVFTSGGTESDNHALAGSVRAAGGGARIVTAATEHHAILHGAEALAAEGIALTVLPVDSCGRIDQATFAAALDERTTASVMYANNEIGTVAPIGALAEIAHRRGATLHTDAVAAACWLSLDVRALQVDALSLSAHKFYGPKGVGILYVKDGTALAPLLHGGGQEAGRRAGTENVAAIAGMAAALEAAVSSRSTLPARIEPLRDRLESGVLASVPAVHANAAGATRLPNIASLTFSGADAAALLAGFDLAGVAVSAGSACTSGALERSHVIGAIGSGGAGDATIRFSLGAGTTGDDIDRVLGIVPDAVAAARGWQAVPA